MMTPIYEVQQEGFTIKQVDENGLVSFIPVDAANSDYQRYLRWLENPEAEHLNGSGLGDEA